MYHVVTVNKLERQEHLPQQLVANIHGQMSIGTLNFIRQIPGAELGLNVESIVFNKGLMIADNVKGGGVGMIRECCQCVHLEQGE